MIKMSVRTLELTARAIKAQQAMNAILSSFEEKSKKDDEKLIFYCKQIEEKKEIIHRQEKEIKALEKELEEPRRKRKEARENRHVGP